MDNVIAAVVRKVSGKVVDERVGRVMVRFADGDGGVVINRIDGTTDVFTAINVFFHSDNDTNWTHGHTVADTVSADEVAAMAERVATFI